MSLNKLLIAPSILVAITASLAAINADAQPLKTEDHLEIEQSSYDQALTQLALIYPEVNRSELTSEIEEIASQNGLSRKEVAESAIKQVNPIYPHPPEQANHKSSRGSRPGKRYLENADLLGDIFVTSAWTSGINHGHVGVFENTSTIIEAVGPGKRSRRYKAEKVEIYNGAVLQHVLASDRNRKRSVAEAANLLNRPYRLVWKWNRQESYRLNCSQLVWLAYVKGAKIDIDSDPQDGEVMPFDIYHSGFTQTYRTLN